MTENILASKSIIDISNKSGNGNPIALIWPRLTQQILIISIISAIHATAGRWPTQLAPCTLILSHSHPLTATNFLHVVFPCPFRSYPYSFSFSGCPFWYYLASPGAAHSGYMSCPLTFHAPHSLLYLFPLVLDLITSLRILSLFMMFNNDLSMLLWATASFSWCFVSPYLCSIGHSWLDEYIHDFSLQANRNLSIFQNMAMLSNLLNPDVILRPISLLISPPDVTNLPICLYSVTSSICSPTIIRRILGLLLATSLHMILVFFLFSFTPSLFPLLFRASIVSFSFSSLSANSIMSSANPKLFSLTPFMLIPASMFILLKIFSTAAANITGDNVSPWWTPFMILIVHWAFLFLIVLFLRCMFHWWCYCTSFSRYVPSVPQKLLYVGQSQRLFHIQQKSRRVECCTPWSI